MADKKIKKVLIGSGIAVGCATLLGVAYHYSLKFLMKLALDRKGPEIIEKNKEKIMFSPEVAEVMALINNAAQDLANLDLEDIEIGSWDGIRLTGHWYCPQNPKRIIIAMHGWRSAWYQDFGTISPFLRDNDCAVLYAEQRGQGNSGGNYMGFGLLERYDCLDWINYINRRTEGRLPIYLAGISMGATSILMAGGLKLPDNVHGIVADCGFTSPHQIWKHVIENDFHLPYTIYSSAAKRISLEKLNISPDAYSTTDALQDCKIPVLFIHGSDDNFVPLDMTFENYKSCSAPKKLLIVPGAEHGMSYIVDKENYEKAVIEFWKEFD